MKNRKRVRNGPLAIMAGLVALMAVFAVFVFVSTASTAMANQKAIINSTTMVVNDNAACDIFKEAHCDAIYEMSAAVTTINTAPAPVAVAATGNNNHRSIINQDAAISHGNNASPPATVADVNTLLRNGINLTVATANWIFVDTQVPVTEGGGLIGQELAGIVG